jgi:hypothetical protein
LRYGIYKIASKSMKIIKGKTKKQKNKKHKPTTGLARLMCGPRTLLPALALTRRGSRSARENREAEGHVLR